MLNRYPSLYVLAAPNGIVSFAPLWRAVAVDYGPIAITFAFPDRAYDMHVAATCIARLSRCMIWLMVPGMERRAPLTMDASITLMMEYRDAIHDRMGWPRGPIIQ